MRWIGLVVVVLTSSVHALAGEFADPPRVAKTEGGVRIAFAVKAPTDVEVAVVDARGKVVRHLAAGVLGGKNAPPLPLQPGLRQRLVWDGKDDLGRAVHARPVQVRVRAGMGVRFGRFLGDNATTGSLTMMPYRAPTNGLVADGKGGLFVRLMSSVGSHGNSGLWPWHLRKFDASGNYVRTLLPYPPSTPAERASGMTLLPTPGAFSPANRTSLYPVFLDLGNELVPRLVNGQVLFVHSERRRLVFLATDGSNRMRTVPMWPPRARLHCPVWLDIQVALSPDGRWAYYANVAGTPYNGKKPSDIDPKWPQGRIYRQDLTREGSEPERFFDLTLPDWEREKYWMPSAWDKKTAAAGVDTDAKGNLLVCDLVNQEVVEVSPAGKRLSATRVPWPDRVLVSRKTGDLYVVSRKVSRGALPAARLIKITGRGDKARSVAELPLKGTLGGACTLDESGKVPVIWLGGHEREADPDSTRLWRVEDRGSEWVVTGTGYLNQDKDAISFVGYMAIDREAELVYVTRSGGKVWRYDGTTGKGGLLPIKAVDLAIGPGGTLYTWGVSGSYEGPIARYTRDLKPAPLSNGKHTFGYVYGRAGRGSSVCGIDVDLHGKVYATFGTNECHVRLYDAEGKLVSFPRKVRPPDGKKDEVSAAITGVTGYGGSLRVDAQGNIYLLQAGVPKEYRPPTGWEKDEAYARCAGTIYKFSPEGGEVLAKGGVVNKVVGAVAQYPGCGPISRWNAVGACACTKPRFDIDGFGRLYIPDGIAFAVSVRDNAGNEIRRFGAYGNLDCAGPASKEPQPAIPLGWPVAVCASDRHVYVGDCLNHRVVRIDRHYAAEATVKVE